MARNSVSFSSSSLSRPLKLSAKAPLEPASRVGCLPRPRSGRPTGQGSRPAAAQPARPRPPCQGPAPSARVCSRRSPPAPGAAARRSSGHARSTAISGRFRHPGSSASSTRPPSRHSTGGRPDPPHLRACRTAPSWRRTSKTTSFAFSKGRLPGLWPRAPSARRRSTLADLACFIFQVPSPCCDP